MYVRSCLSKTSLIVKRRHYAKGVIASPRGDVLPVTNAKVHLCRLTSVIGRLMIKMAQSNDASGWLERNATFGDSNAAVIDEAKR